MAIQDLGVGGTAASSVGSELSGLQNFLANPGQSILDFVGLDWINTGAVDLATQSIPEGIEAPLVITVDGQTPGAVTLRLPNAGPDLGKIAVQLASIALSTIEITQILQNLFSVEGGLRVKDALGPYNYQVLKNALEENGEPVPEVTPNAAGSQITQLGGQVADSGAFTGVQSILQGLSAAGKLGPLLSAVNVPIIAPTTGTGITVTGGVPAITLQLKLINTALQVINFSITFVKDNFINSADLQAGAILLRNVMDEFSVQVSSNALESAGRPVPEPETPAAKPSLFRLFSG